MYIYNYLYTVPQIIDTFFSITKAKADTSTEGIVFNGIDCTPYVFGLFAFLTVASAYAAIFSKKPKVNDNGWDMIKILFGAAAGYFLKTK